jgi:hypothetical protein
MYAYNTYTHTQLYMHTHTQTSKHTHTDTHTHTRAHVHTHTHTHTHQLSIPTQLVYLIQRCTLSVLLYYGDIQMYSGLELENSSVAA